MRYEDFLRDVRVCIYYARSRAHHPSRLLDLTLSDPPPPSLTGV